MADERVGATFKVVCALFLHIKFSYFTGYPDFVFHKE